MHVRAYATLRDLLGKNPIELPTPEGTTVRDVLRHLVTVNPDFGERLWDSDQKLTGYVQVFVNGRAIQYLAGLDTPAANSDTLSLFPPVGGGCAGFTGILDEELHHGKA